MWGCTPSVNSTSYTSLGHQYVIQVQSDQISWRVSAPIDGQNLGMRSPLDFRTICISKCLTFDYFVEASDLLSDKAISTCRSSSFENFDRTAYRAYYDKQPPHTSEAELRVIPQYLFHANVFVKEVND